MNVTELARILKVTPQELRDYLPQLGFDIGQKAIKINNNVANKIIREWSNIQREIAKIKDAAAKKQTQTIVVNDQPKKIITLPKYITVRDFSNLAGLPINSILTELMKNGIFISLNEKVDYDTAWLVGSELGLEIKPAADTESEQKNENNKLKEILATEKSGDLAVRPPVIVVMGHVDHGKTKLLDTIRTAHVIDGEAGGITQHIGAYQAKHKDRLITFIDTPGHEAFTAMRGRGAKIADVAILVVAADDGVKPQTVEAYRIIEAAQIPFVVAMNKIDKPEANVEKTKQELSTQLNILSEDWGGKIVCVPISAKNGTGIEELLDMVLLTAETEADSMKANPNASAVGTVIESHVDKGSGPVATILVQNGTLHLGDQLCLNSISIGKVRSIKDYRGENITSAAPSTPVQIVGLKNMPQVGDVIEVGEGEKVKFRKAGTYQTTSASDQSGTTSESDDTTKKINLIIKSDVLGSAEAIEESLEKINTSEVKIKILHKGLGNITDGDIKRAEAAGSTILGFNVKLLPPIEEMAREKNIEIKLYSIIYDLINDIKDKIQVLTGPKFKRVDLGELKVLAIFRSDKKSQIIGGKVISGQLENNALIEVVRQQEIITKGKVNRLQSGKQDTNAVANGQECGAQFEGEPLIQVNDILRFYKEVEIAPKT
jgi:translation initiation factor IF-2